MTNMNPLTTGTVIHHSHFGKGKVVCQYEDASVGDMVEVHWLDRNEVLDHREENLQFGLTSILPPDTKAVSPWLQLLQEE